MNFFVIFNWSKINSVPWKTENDEPRQMCRCEQLAEWGKQQWSKTHTETRRTSIDADKKLILAITFSLIVVINFVKSEKKRWCFNCSKMQTTRETFPLSVCVRCMCTQTAEFIVHRTYVHSHTHYHLIKLTFDAVFCLFYGMVLGDASVVRCILTAALH